MIFLIGFLDDTLGLRARLRLFLQIIASLSFVVITNTYILDFEIFTLSSVLATAFAIFCIVGLINAYNMFDGLNGLCSGSALIYFISISFLSHMYNYSIMLTISSVFIGSLLAFLLFNFPSGRIFLGDAGSYLIGFSVASISLIMAKEVPNISPWTFLLLSIIPIFDTLFAIYRRARQGDSPLMPDKKHLHHILRRRYKSCSKAVVHLWLIQILLSISAILFHRNYILLISIILFSVFLLRRLWYKKIEFTISPVWKVLAFKPIKILLLILLVLLIPVYAHPEISDNGPRAGAPAIPNETRFEGAVLEECAGSSGLYDISPEQTIYRLRVRVESYKEEAQAPNFLRGRIGEAVLFFTKEKPREELLGKRIRAVAEYRGDERGGKFWIKNIKIFQ